MDEKQDKRTTLFEKHRENVYFRWGLTAFLVIVACVLVANVLFNLDRVSEVARRLTRALAPALYGLAIAYLLDPIVWRVQKFLRPRLEPVLKDRADGVARGVGIFAALVLLVLIVWALLSMILPQLLESLNTIIGNLPSYYNTLRGWVDRFIDDNLEIADFTNAAMNTVYNYLQNWLSATLLPQVQTWVVNLTTSVVGMARALLNLIIGLIISVYLLIGKEKFLCQARKLCYALLGTKRGGYVCNVCTFANQVFGGFIGGKILDSAIIGVLCFLGLSLMKMPYTLLISIIVGVTNIIPFFGPYLGAIPSALLLLVIDPLHALYFVIFILILQQLDGNLIGPMILGDATGVSGFWVVVSLLLFGSLFGILGMILGVPLFAVIYQIVSETTNWLLRRRGLSTATDDYDAWTYPPRPHPERWRRPRNNLLRRGLRRKTARPASGDAGGSDGPQTP